jgi:hypothetical protein
MKRISITKIVTAILLLGFILTGFIDLLVQDAKTYSSIMGLDIGRVYFYTFFSLTLGCWLLYNKWFVGIGFLTVATFNSYFPEFLFIHNYFASVAVYIGIVIDILVRKGYKWLIPLLIVGIIQGIAFNLPGINYKIYYLVGGMEFTALCVGSVFVVKKI